MQSEKYSAALVQRALQQLHPLDVLEFLDYHPELMRRVGADFEYACPLCARPGETPRLLLVNEETRTVRCRDGSCTQRASGDLIELAARAWGWSYDAALERLATEFDIALIEDNSPEDVERRLAEVAELVELMQMDEDNAAQYLEQGRALLDPLLAERPDCVEASEAAVRMALEAGAGSVALSYAQPLARHAAHSSRVEGCVALFREIAHRVPEEAEPQFALARVYRTAGRAADALDAYMVGGTLAERSGEFERALDGYKSARELGELGLDLDPLIAHLLAATGRREEALASLREKADRLATDGRTEDAILALGELTDIAPDDDDATIAMLQLQLDRGLRDAELTTALRLVDGMLRREAWDRAASALASLEGIFPDHPGIIEGLIRARRALGEYEVVETLQYRLVGLSRECGDLGRARVILEEILSEFPQDAHALREAASIAAEQSDSSGALDYFKRLLAIVEGEGDAAQALEVATEMVAAAPNSSDARMKRVGLLLAAERRDEAIEELFAAARTLRRQGNAEKLIELLQYALTLDADNPQFLLLYGEALDLQGKWGEAYLERIRACEVLIARRDFPEAEKQLDFILQLDDRRTRALELHAQVLAEQGRLREAREVSGNLVSILMDVEDHAKCREVLEEMLKLEPDDLGPLEQLVDVCVALADEEGQIESRCRLAAFHKTRRRFDEAIEQIEAILALSPDNPSGLAELVDIYTLRGERTKATETSQHLARVYRDRGDSEGEARVLTERVEREPYDFPARERLLELMLAGDGESLARAFDDYAAAAAAAEQTSRVLDFGRSLLLLDLDNITLHRRMIALYGMHGLPLKQAEQLLTLAGILEQEGHWSQVADTLDEFLTLEPADRVQRLRMAEASLKANETERATRGLMLVADADAAQERWDEAEALCKRVLDLAPENEPAREMMARAALRRGEPDEAVYHLRELAMAQANADRLDEALATLDGALKHGTDAIAVRRSIVDVCLRGESRRLPLALEQLDRIADDFASEGNEQACLDARREAVDIAPDNPELRRTLVKQLVVFGRVGQAATELVELGHVARRDLDYDEALARYGEALTIDPENVKARTARAELFEEMGDDKQALAEWRSIAPLIHDGRLTSSDQVMLPPPQLLAAVIVKEYDFERFVVGERNRFAWATAMAIAKSPGQTTHNPLFLWGDVGMGKTHILHAIANRVLAEKAGSKVLYTSAEDFTSELIDAIQGNTVMRFRAKHKALDLLLLDDVHFLAGKERAQEEFFHIFNTLFQARRQIVVTSDRPPKDIAQLEKRLKSRFGAGVIVDIQAPEVETRIAILRRAVQERGESVIPDDTLEVLAQGISSNIRQLKAALNQLLLLRDTGGEQLTPETARRVLEQVAL